MEKNRNKKKSRITIRINWCYSNYLKLGRVKISVYGSEYWSLWMCLESQEYCNRWLFRTKMIYKCTRPLFLQKFCWLVLKRIDNRFGGSSALLVRQARVGRRCRERYGACADDEIHCATASSGYLVTVFHCVDLWRLDIFIWTFTRTFLSQKRSCEGKHNFYYFFFTDTTHDTLIYLNRDTYWHFVTRLLLASCFHTIS